jgi:BMFP domain-containing protein YqiC
MEGGEGQGTGGPGGGRGGKRGLFDDLAGVAGGAFSVMAGARAELEAMARAQMEAMVQRLELVRREDLDAALEVARRAREEAETLSTRIAALEARLAAMETQPEGGEGEGTVP